MSDMADWTTDQGELEKALHDAGRCGEIGGPCPLCEDEAKRLRAERDSRSPRVLAEAVRVALHLRTGYLISTDVMPSIVRALTLEAAKAAGEE